MQTMPSSLRAARQAAARWRLVSDYVRWRCREAAASSLQSDGRYVEYRQADAQAVPCLHPRWRMGEGSG